MRDVDQLTACLADLDRDGWKSGDEVAGRPEVSGSLRASLRAAARVKALTRPIPSDAFRARSRSHLITFIQNNALPSPGPSSTEQIRQGLFSIFRPIVAPLVAATLIVIGLAGVWSASAAALPGSTLYPAKIAIEEIQVLAALTPDQQVWVHLHVASTRLQEANAVIGAGQTSEGQDLLQAFDREIAKAQSILLTVASSPGSDKLLAQSDLQIVLLQQERQRLVASGLSSTSPIASTQGTSASLVQSTGSPVVVAGASVAVTTTTSPVNPTTTPPPGTNPVADTGISGGGPADASPSAGPAERVGVDGAGVAESDAATGAAASVAVADRIHRLILVLIAEATAGDSAAANRTAQELILEINAGQVAHTLSIERLRIDRGRLEEALLVAPASTKASLRLVLELIDAVVQGSSPTSSPTSLSPTTPPPTSIVSMIPAVPSVAVQLAPVAPTPIPVQVVSTTIPLPALPTPIPQPEAPKPITQPLAKEPSLGSQLQMHEASEPRPPVVNLSTITGPFFARPVIVREPVHVPSPTLTEPKPSVLGAR